jgi:hypothetical protein
MWEENVYHLALSTGTTEFLWWQPGSMRPLGSGLPLLSRTLAELSAVTGLDEHGGAAACTLTPLETNRTKASSFAVSFLMSAVKVSCSDGFEREVFRFTPRCTRTVWCTWWGDDHYPPKNGSVSPSWRIGTSLALQFFPGKPLQAAAVLC